MAPGSRIKFGAPMFAPELRRKQMDCVEESACDMIGTFRRPPQPFSVPIVICHPGNCVPSGRNSGVEAYLKTSITASHDCVLNSAAFPDVTRHSTFYFYKPLIWNSVLVMQALAFAQIWFAIF